MSTLVMLRLSNQVVLAAMTDDRLLVAVSEVARNMGLTIDKSDFAAVTNTVDIPLDNAREVVAAGSGQTGRTFRGNGLEVVFLTDIDGNPGVRVSGDRDDETLREIGETMAKRIVQQYAYHRLVSEMKQRNMNIVEDRVEQDGSVRLRVRAG